MGEQLSVNQRLTDALGHFIRRGRGARGERSGNDFWALRNVDLDVDEGSVVGLIGRNGAGKSTLLKILSRITFPTEGTVLLSGRVGSLLEVGTGFHGELTGRENALLNGAILGMSRREILSRLDDIVEFAGVGAFLDTPVKRYSTGMYMRLAFSVAAFLETEILLVDEVLAVGDVAFQRRCLGKMGEVSRSGRTVVFVSHNLGSIAQLCSSAVWLDKGEVQAQGVTADVIQEYLSSHATPGENTAAWTREPAPSGGQAGHVVAVALLNPQGLTSAVLDCDDPLEIVIDVDLRRVETGTSIAFYLRNSRGVIVVSSDLVHATPSAIDELRTGLNRFRITIPQRLIAPDEYSISVMIRSPYLSEIDEVVDVCSVTIVDTSTPAGSRRAGVVGLNLPWRHALVDAADEPGPPLR